MELRVSRRYAGALFELACEREILDSTSEELRVLAEVFRGNSELRAFLSNALIAEERQVELLVRITDRLGLGDLLQRFVEILLSRGRLAFVPSIEDHFFWMLDEHRGIVSAEVETARPLDDEARRRLVEALSIYTGKSVRLSEVIVPELIAGFRVRLGSLLIDGTLERQLAELNRVILS